MIEPQLLMGLDYNFHQINLAISHLVSTGVLRLPSVLSTWDFTDISEILIQLIVCRRECTTVHTVFSQIKTLKEISFISLLSSTVQTVEIIITDY
ncbi:MAG: hypothetical protein UR85_C0001G0002 [Candidatus Nomurabacteria bacterium GW2011_GWF2_35_66]|nr:MAG: hypothetical protein UR55_C0003G0003 [Candidatus Nomurabacteria bacterium GW2011_GWF1_34_20]KKP63515.1 MAG: hypothetical protein UR57_C0003G0002 [Candidatus Nomurabacteria bacterium GW2011_GWE2_34_25]KKP83807.1 MAG: hypothetical protein UR85_C0001G0002 [Candidatus Nomurabacteria bacterium GW2011_GWF2_35_66]